MRLRRRVARTAPRMQPGHEPRREQSFGARAIRLDCSGLFCFDVGVGIAIGILCLSLLHMMRSSTRIAHAKPVCRPKTCLRGCSCQWQDALDPRSNCSI